MCNRMNWKRARKGERRRKKKGFRNEKCTSDLNECSAIVANQPRIKMKLKSSKIETHCYNCNSFDWMGYCFHTCSFCLFNFKSHIEIRMALSTFILFHFPCHSPGNIWLVFTNIPLKCSMDDSHHRNPRHSRNYGFTNFSMRLDGWRKHCCKTIMRFGKIQICSLFSVQRELGHSQRL